MEPTPEQREKWDLEQIKQSKSRLNARPIASVIRRLLNSRAYGEIQSSKSLQACWAELVGDQLLPVTRLGKIANGALLVEANSSQALQELHFMAPTLLKRLQADLPELKIKRLNLRMGSF